MGRSGVMFDGLKVRVRVTRTEKQGRWSDGKDHGGL